MPSMLIVDDDPHLRRLVRTYAQLEQFQCREADSGQQALALLREADSDIIILDPPEAHLAGDHAHRPGGGV